MDWILLHLKKIYFILTDSPGFEFRGWKYQDTVTEPGVTGWVLLKVQLSFTSVPLTASISFSVLISIPVTCRTPEISTTKREQSRLKLVQTAHFIKHSNVLDTPCHVPQNFTAFQYKMWVCYFLMATTWQSIPQPDCGFTCLPVQQRTQQIVI